MDRVRFTTIAHRDHVLLSPIRLAKLDRMIALIDLALGERVLDIGCGTGETLIRLTERFRARGVGVDTNAEFIAAARRRAAGRVALGDLELHLMDASSFVLAPESYGAIVCLGATGALGGYREVLRAAKPALRRGGQLLIGEGYWRREPAPEYLSATGIPREEMTDHAGTVKIAEDEGWVPMYATTSDQDEWDEYEGLYARAIERHLLAHPEDPDAEEMRERIRKWRNAYLTWGRDTLGYGLYLFARP